MSSNLFPPGGFRDTIILTVLLIGLVNDTYFILTNQHVALRELIQFICVCKLPITWPWEFWYQTQILLLSSIYQSIIQF